MNIGERDGAVVEVLAAVSQLNTSVHRIAHPVSTPRLVPDHADVLDATARIRAAVVARVVIILVRWWSEGRTFARRGPHLWRGILLIGQPRRNVKSILSRVYSAHPPVAEVAPSENLCADASDPRNKLRA